MSDILMLQSMFTRILGKVSATDVVLPYRCSECLSVVLIGDLISHAALHEKADMWDKEQLIKRAEQQRDEI